MRVLGIAAAAAGLIWAATVYGQSRGEPEGSATGLETMTGPQYTEDGHLIRPEGYRTWIFVGASLGLDYSSPEEPEGPRRFHHVYIQPEAYAHFQRTGEFPEKTMLVMENYSAGSKEDNTAGELIEHKKEMPILHGHFEDTRVGLEVALKDGERFEEGWAYFVFGMRDTLRETAMPFPKGACWQCHNDHAAYDNVFLQFYPVLREALADANSRGKDDTDK